MVIPDMDIHASYLALYNGFNELLPGGADAMAHYTEVEPAAKAEHFTRDLKELRKLVAELRNELRTATLPFGRGW
jgi:hypothetical protein